MTVFLDRQAAQESCSRCRITVRMAKKGLNSPGGTVRFPKQRGRFPIWRWVMMGTFPTRAGVAQLVEHNVANVVVVGSSPITRSIFI